MPILSLGFLTGILLSLCQSQLLHHYSLISLLVLSLLLAPIKPLRILAMVVAGFSLASMTGMLRLSAQLPEPLIKQDVVVQGQIDGLVEHRGPNVRFNLRIDELNYRGQSYPFPGLIRLTWYHRNDENLQAGQQWQLKVRLKPPHGTQNPGHFDYETWIFHKGIRATGYVRSSADNRLLQAANGVPLTRLRGQLRQDLQVKLQTEEGRSIFPALLLGDRSAMSTDQWQVLLQTGTSHLLAISGLHIGIIAMLAFAAALYCVRWFPRLLMRMPARLWAALAAILAATLYALLSGFAVPAQRALVMLLVVMAGLLWYRHARFIQLISLALILVLIMEPLAPLSASFWLSFYAVVILAYGMSYRLQRQPWYWLWPRAQWYLFWGLLPWLGYWFGQISWLAPWVNMVAIPWVTVVLWSLVIALLSPLPFLADSFWVFAEWLFQKGWSILTYLAQGVETMPLWVDIWQLPLLLLASLIMLLPKGIHGRLLGFVSLVAIISWQPQPLDEGAYRLTVLDVGQGLAVVVETRDHSLVFDAGPRYSSQYDSGAQIVLPFMRQKRINHLDKLIISHADNDHIGGANAIIQAITIDEITSSVPQQLAGATSCVAPREWQWNHVQFRLLHPPAETLLRGNNRSCVLLVEGRGGRSLLTGDIEAEAENELLRYLPQFPIEVIIAPHHGSKTSSTRDFVGQIRPQFVVFSSGYKNRYGFPHPEVVKRYQAQGAMILNTATSGAITFLIHPATALQYAEYRRSNQRYWHFDGASTALQ